MSSSPLLLPKPNVHRYFPCSTTTRPWKSVLPPYHCFHPPPTPPPHPEAAQLPLLVSSIKHLTSQLHLSHAFTAYSALRRQSLPIQHQLAPISSLLICSSTLRALPQGRQLHAHVFIRGFLPKFHLSAKLVSLYTNCDRFADAAVVAEESGVESPLPWNVLISAYVSGGFCKEAVSAYRRMVGKGGRGDAFTYPSVFKACGELQAVGLGKKIHDEVERDGLGSNLFVQNSLVSMYVKFGEMKVAKMLFEEMSERDEVSWNAMISGYSSKEMWMEAFEVFERMKGGGVKANVVTWNTVAGGYLQMGNHMEALRLVSEIRNSGCAVDHVTFVIGLRASSQIGSVMLGKAFHGMAIRAHNDGIETVRNALITMYSRCKDNASARLLFQMFEDRSLVTWNCMITGYCLLDQSDEASSTFREMVWSGIQPNFVTVVTILSLSARVANLQHGKELHCYIIKHRFEGHCLLGNSLVDMYSKSGRIREARRVFDSMNDRDEVSYTSLITGYGMQGEGHLALELFDEMRLLGIKPDHVTMVAVLSACSHAKLVVQGQVLFDSMLRSYGVTPVMEHYSCMVDLLARAGMLSKAEEFLANMPLKPSAAMWASLVGACHVYRNTRIGERAAGKLLELKPDNPGHYVLIANMYAAAGCWGELANVRTLMRDKGIRKVPGCAWVDVGNVLYPFLVGDKENPDSCEIYRLLDLLTEHLKDAGYAGNAYLGFDEEDAW